MPGRVTRTSGTIVRFQRSALLVGGNAYHDGFRAVKEAFTSPSCLVPLRRVSGGSRPCIRNGSVFYLEEGRAGRDVMESSTRWNRSGGKPRSVEPIRKNESRESPRILDSLPVHVYPTQMDQPGAPLTLYIRNLPPCLSRLLLAGPSCMVSYGVDCLHPVDGGARKAHHIFLGKG